MRLISLEIDSFKNYGKLSVDLTDKNLVILLGNNGQGKTNFLEAIVLLALSKSYQPSTLRDFVNWSLDIKNTGLPEYFRISGRIIDSAGKNLSLEIGCGKTAQYPKALKIDEVKVKPYDYIGHLRVVLFTPQDMNMMFLSPQLRRRYINIFISQLDPEYLRHLGQYQVILKHRNKLLSALQDEVFRAQELEYWDEKLAEHGAYLLWKRREVFQFFNEHLSQQYDRLSHQTVSLELVWNKEWEARDLSQYREVFRDYLLSKRDRDIEVGRTCGGPHREDFFFRMNDRNLAEFGSRGECRSAILALKLSEAALLREQTGDAPLLLLDDVFSELDPDRQKNLLKLFDVEQVFITTTHLDFEHEGATVWRVEEGKISSE